MQETQQATVRYFLVGTAKERETVKMIGWPTAATMETVEEKHPNLSG